MNYIGQIEDDLIDLVDWIKKNNPNSRVILEGHSFGGATALRFAGGQYSNQIDAYLFLAPFIHPNAPTIRKSDTNGHTKASLFKIILLSLFEQLRIRQFHHLEVLTVNKPIETRHGSETLNISYRLAMSRFPQKYQEAIKSITQPTLVIVGGNDELFYSEKFESIFALNQNITTKTIPGHNHDGILFSSRVFKEVEEWLIKLMDQLS